MMFGTVGLFVKGLYNLKDSNVSNLRDIEEGQPTFW
jgi:hypothetical protein